MPKQETIQCSFTGGELGPSLKGRTDLSQYGQAAAVMQNFLVRPFGSTLSTPGLEFINPCITGGSTTISGVRLIPFIFSVTDCYMIEMGVGYFNFYYNGAVVVSTGTTPYSVAHTYAAADIPSIQYCQDNDVIYLFHGNYQPQTLTRLGSTNWVLAAFPFTGGPFQATNTNTSLTVNVNGSSGSVTIAANSNIFTPSSGVNVGHVGAFFSIGSTVTSSTTGLDVQGYLTITAVTNPSTATATVQSLLSTSGTTSIWALPSWSYPSGWPARGCFMQSRLFAARTATEPQTVWGTANFVFTNYAVNGGANDDALNLQLAATQSNDIKWMAPMNDLIVGTYGGEFIITAGIGTGNPLTPASASVIQQTSWGSEAIVPKKIGNFCYYVQRGAQKLREILYDFLSSSYKSSDLTILSPHIQGGAFVDMTYQQNPDTVLWLVCSNGTIATLTREVDQKVQGWARQVTAGNFISIASIPSQNGPYDEVWVIVTRTINGSQVNYVERFASQLLTMQGTGSQTPQQDQLFYVHCGLTYDAFSATSSPTATSISLGSNLKTIGSTLLVTSSAAYFTSSDVGERLRAVDQYDNILGEITITSYGSTTLVAGTVTYPFTAPSYSAGYWGISVSQISGLNQLIGQTVVVCADGGTDYPSKVVTTAGTITLAYNYFVVSAGLPAPQIFVSLPQEPPSDHGTSQGKKQRISEVAFKVNNSYAGFHIGGTTGTLYPIAYRQPATLLGMPKPLVTGIIPNVPFSDNSQGGYNYGAQVQIYNADPLPVELLSLITKIETFTKE